MNAWAAKPEKAGKPESAERAKSWAEVGAVDQAEKTGESSATEEKHAKKEKADEESRAHKAGKDAEEKARGQAKRAEHSRKWWKFWGDKDEAPSVPSPAATEKK